MSANSSLKHSKTTQYADVHAKPLGARRCVAVWCGPPLTVTYGKPEAELKQNRSVTYGKQEAEQKQTADQKQRSDVWYQMFGVGSRSLVLVAELGVGS